jgi:hypothetical protein
MELKIVNAEPRYAPVTLVEPATRGYIHVAAEVRPRRLPFQQGLPAGREKVALLGRLTELARQLERLEAVETVTVYDALAIAPARSGYLRERRDLIRVARFDLVVLVETTSVAAIRDVQATDQYAALVEELQLHAKRLHVMAARNAKRIGDVDTSRDGLFLFNYFVADDAGVLLQLWDYLAGWYAAETGLDNSTLLVPLEGEHSDYLAINHARWDESLPRFLWQQVSTQSFRTYMLANIEVNRVGAMPALYRLAGRSQSAARPLRRVLRAASVVGLGAAVVFMRRRRASRAVPGRA